MMDACATVSMFQYQWKNVTYIWLNLKTRRIVPPFIRHRIHGILFVCICFLIMFYVLMSNQETFEEIAFECNNRALETQVDIEVEGQIRPVKSKRNDYIFVHNEIRTILLWTKFFSEEFSRDFYFFLSGKQTFQAYNCTFSNCLVTSNRSLLPTVDAVLFHERDLNFSDIPKRVNDSQIWILYSIESPKYIVLKWNLIRSLFNWTMTYRSDSDVQVKYGEILPNEDKCKVPFARHRNVSQRTKGAIWMVSNCRTQSNREAYVRELKKFFDVDVYGKCSRTKRCEPAQSDACYKLLNSYKYYLSFENSICKDYITEKFFNVLQYDIIPVVLGGGNYTAIAPPNSFIDASKFPDPRNLAKHLNDVANNFTWYDSFFEWKGQYKVYLHSWMCDLCERLHKDRFKTRTLPTDLWSWWVQESFCQRWTKKKRFKNLF